MSEFHRVRQVAKDNPELLYYMNLVCFELFENLVDNDLVQNTYSSFRQLSDDQIMRSIIRAQNSDRQHKTLQSLNSIAAYVKSPTNSFLRFSRENGRLSTVLVFAAVKGANEHALRKIVQSWLWTRFSGVSLAGTEMPHDKHLSDDHAELLARTYEIIERQRKNDKTDPNE